MVLEDLRERRCKVDAGMGLPANRIRDASSVQGKSFTHLRDFDDVQQERYRHSLRLQMDGYRHVSLVVGRRPGVRCEVEFSLVFLQETVDSMLEIDRDTNLKDFRNPSASAREDDFDVSGHC